METHEKVIAWLILLIFIGMIATALSSDEVDDLCNQNNNLLRRTNGTWQCRTDTTPNIFDQTLNTTSNVTHNSIIATSRVEGVNNTQFGDWVVVRVGAGDAHCQETCAKIDRACIMGMDTNNNWIFQNCTFGGYVAGDDCLCAGRTT